MALHALRDGGMDARDAQAILSLAGASPEAKAAMEEFLMLCRKLIVEYATKTGQRFYPVDRPPKTDKELVKLAKSHAVMGSQRDWDLITVMEGSYLDEHAILIIGKLFGLPETGIVQEDERTERLFDVINAPEEELGAPRPLGEYLLIHHPRRAHFEALVPKESTTAPLVDPCGPGDVIWAVQYLTELLKMNFTALVDDAEKGGETDGETDGETVSDAGTETPPDAVTEGLPEAATKAETDGETDSGDASPGLVSDGKVLGDWSDDQCPCREGKRVDFEDMNGNDELRSYAYDTGNMYGVLEMDGEDGPDDHLDGDDDHHEHDDPRGSPPGSVDEENDTTADDTPREHDDPRGSVDEPREHASAEDEPREHVGADDPPQDAPGVGEEDEWMPRVHVTKPRSWRRTGRRRLKHKNRRRREKRRRRCRHHRQRCGAGGLRRRALIRGGANPGDGQRTSARAKRAPRAPDEAENLSANTRYDDAWFSKRWPGVDSKLTDQQKRDKEKVRLWTEGEKQKKIDDARCQECKRKTAPDPDNPIIVCDGCDGGALHFRCTKKFPLEAIPGEKDKWFCDACREKRGEIPPVQPPVQPTVADGPGATQPQSQPMVVEGPGSPQPQPQPMNVDGPGSTQPQQQPGGVGGTMERDPVSTVARASTPTKRKGRAASKGKAKAGKTKAGSTARKVRKRRVRRPDRVTAKEYARILEAHWDVLSDIFMKQSKAKAAEQLHKFGGTCPRAGSEPSHAITSIPLIAKLLTKGLCDDPLDGIEISNGVYFKYAALEALESCFNWEYAFDPKSIGVVLGETKVEVEGEELVVNSFDHGEYTLSDGSIMHQWALLEKRTGDDGVTLESEQRRFIIHLVTTYVNMMVHVVPAVITHTKDESKTKTMLWNPNTARANET
ncbi:unnamed protein product [Ectocarpus sp. 12 AP-2014]